jgi:hypothetical protein
MCGSTIGARMMKGGPETIYPEVAHAFTAPMDIAFCA